MSRDISARHRQRDCRATPRERSLTTKEGGDRYLVLVEDEIAKEFKFFTNSEEMKQILDKTREAGEIPFRTVIRRKTFGEGKKKYCFT